MGLLPPWEVNIQHPSTSVRGVTVGSKRWKEGENLSQCYPKLEKVRWVCGSDQLLVGAMAPTIEKTMGQWYQVLACKNIFRSSNILKHGAMATVTISVVAKDYLVPLVIAGFHVFLFCFVGFFFFCFLQRGKMSHKKENSAWFPGLLSECCWSTCFILNTVGYFLSIYVQISCCFQDDKIRDRIW